MCLHMIIVKMFFQTHMQNNARNISNQQIKNHMFWFRTANMKLLTIIGLNSTRKGRYPGMLGIFKRTRNILKEYIVLSNKTNLFVYYELIPIIFPGIKKNTQRSPNPQNTEEHMEYGVNDHGRPSLLQCITATISLYHSNNLATTTTATQF